MRPVCFDENFVGAFFFGIGHSQPLIIDRWDNWRISDLLLFASILTLNLIPSLPTLTIYWRRPDLFSVGRFPSLVPFS